MNNNVLSTVIITIAAFILFACSNSENETLSSVITKTSSYKISSDTTFIGEDGSFIKIIPIDSLPNNLKSYLSSNNSNANIKKLGRYPMNTGLTAFYFYDDDTEKKAYAVQNPIEETTWAFECYSKNETDSVFLEVRFKSEYTFDVVNKDWEYRRPFTYDPETNELISREFYLQGRPLSDRDKYLCNSAFIVVGSITSWALAVPTLGGSVLLGLAFYAVSDYVCQ